MLLTTLSMKISTKKPPLQEGVSSGGGDTAHQEGYKLYHSGKKFNEVSGIIFYLVFSRLPMSPSARFVPVLGGREGKCLVAPTESCPQCIPSWGSCE